MALNEDWLEVTGRNDANKAYNFLLINQLSATALIKMHHNALVQNKKHKYDGIVDWLSTFQVTRVSHFSPVSPHF